jgi:hypothetical protein
MAQLQRIAPCLWFDTQAEEAASFYTGIFPNSRIVSIAHYSEAGQEAHGKPPGSVMTVAFTLDGQEMLALNGGPHFTFNPAVSLMINCDSRRAAVRLAGRPLRPVVAGDAARLGGLDERARPGRRAARHGGHDEDEEARHRRPAGGLRRAPIFSPLPPRERGRGRGGAGDQPCT